jgi:signal transduction histidine kinase
MNPDLASDRPRPGTPGVPESGPSGLPAQGPSRAPAGERAPDKEARDRAAGPHRRAQAAAHRPGGHLDASPRRASRVLGALPWTLAAAAVAYASDWFSMQFTLPGSVVSLVYPQMGLMVALGILVGPWVAVGAFLGEMALWLPVVGAPWVVAGFALAGALQVAVVSFVVRRFLGGRDALGTRLGVVRFAAVAGLLGTVISATGGVGTLHLAGMIPGPEVLMSWLAWWAADVVSVLLFTSSILVWSRPSWAPSAPARERAVVAILFAVVPLALLLVPLPHSTFALTLLGLPMIVWAAFRYGSRSVAMLGLALALAAFGRFALPQNAADADVGALLEAQTFIALAVVFGLTAAAAFARERRQLTEASALRATNETRDRFVRFLAHEIGNPLTPILLQADALRKGRAGDLTPKQDAMVASIERSALRLGNLVKDLRGVEVLQPGESFSIDPTHIDLVQVTSVVAKSYVEEAARADVRIELVGEGHARTAADPNRIAQVLSNLVNNAIKYSLPGGTVRIEVRTDGAQSAVAVRDEGCGLTEDQIAHLFKPFAKVHPPGTQRHGSGLGLHISREIVEGHGGRLECRSDGPGRGSTFTMVLPTGRPARPQSPPRTPEGVTDVPPAA